MSALRIVSVLIVVLVTVHLGGIAQMPDRDVAYSQTVVFKLKEHDENSYTLSSEVSTEVKLLSQRSTKVDDFTISEPFFAPIKKLKVKVNSSSISSNLISYGAANWSDVFLSDHKLYTIHFPSTLKTGDVVSYSYRQEYSDVAFTPILYVPNIDSLRVYRVVFEHPDDVSIDFEFYFPRDSIPYTIDRGETDETSLTFGRVDYEETLMFFPNDHYQAAVLCRLRRGDHVITPVRPDEYVVWYHRQARPSPSLDSADRHMFDSKLVGTKSLMDTLGAIYDFVRTTIRYIADERGMNAFIPHPPSLTLASKFGDCKDRVALVAGIAGEYGITTMTVLVPSTMSPSFAGVHVGMFNHVICAFQSGSQLIYFDPTSKYCEFGNLPDSDIGKRVFLVEAGRFDTVAQPKREPSLDITIQGGIDSIRQCRALVVLRNDNLINALHARHDFTEDKFNRLLKSFVADNLYQVQLDSFNVVSEEPGRMTIEAQADLSKFILVSEGKYYVPRTPFARFDNDILDRESDKYPIMFSATVDLRFRLIIHTVGIAVQPEVVRSGNERFLFTAQAGDDGNDAQFDYRYRRTALVVPPEEKIEFINNYKTYLDNKRSVFVMKRR